MKARVIILTKFFSCTGFDFDIDFRWDGKRQKIKMWEIIGI